MQHSNKGQVPNERGPARAEEDRDTGQGTSGVVMSFFLFLFVKCQEAGQQEATKRSTTLKNDGRVRRNTLANVGRWSRSAQFSQSIGLYRTATDVPPGRVGKGTGPVGVVACHQPWTVG